MEFYCNTLRNVNKRGNEIVSLKLIYVIIHQIMLTLNLMKMGL